MIKLSELPMDTMLVIEDVAMTKEQYLDSAYYLDCEDVKIYVGEPSFANFSWDDEIERESEEMYEDWQDHILSDITKAEWEVLKKAEEIINKAYADRPTYWEGKPVEVDMKRVEGSDGE
jgi:hypothetical protein